MVKAWVIEEVFGGGLVVFMKMGDGGARRY